MVTHGLFSSRINHMILTTLQIVHKINTTLVSYKLTICFPFVYLMCILYGRLSKFFFGKIFFSSTMCYIQTSVSNYVVLIAQIQETYSLTPVCQVRGVKNSDVNFSTFFFRLGMKFNIVSSKHSYIALHKAILIFIQLM